MEPAPPSVPRRGLRGLLSLLERNPDYRRLFLAALVSMLGDWFAFVAVSGLVTEVTGRTGMPALVYAASVLPVFLVSPLSGVVADRVDRRRMMIAVDLLRVAPALGLVAAAALGSAGLAIGCVLALATLSAFFEPVVAAVTPNLVDDDDLPLAQAALGSAWGSMLFVGAALGGLVAATLGRDASFVMNALTFVASALLLLRIRRPFQRERAARATVGAHLAEVWAFVRPRPVSRALLATKVGVGVANGIVGLLPAYALSRFGAGDAGIGVLLGARGLGALLGPWLGARLARAPGSSALGLDGRRLFLVCGASILAYGTAYAVLPSASSLLVAAGCVLFAHVGGGAQWVLSTYGLQVTTPDRLRGRVLALDFGLATLAMGLSALAASGAAEAFGLREASYGLVAVGVVYGASWLWWTRALWRGSSDPLAAAPTADARRAEALASDARAP